MPWPISKSWAGFAILLSLTAHAAHAQRVGQPITFEPPALPIGEARIAARDSSLLTQLVRSDQHVKLQQPVQAEYRHTTRTNHIDLPAGALLHAASPDGDIFCAPLDQKFGACLEDTDGDGRFDVIYEATVGTGSWNYLAFHTDGSFSKGLYASPRRLPPTPFVQAGPDEVLTSQVEVVTSSVFSEIFRNRPTKSTLYLYVGPDRVRALHAYSSEFALDAEGRGRGAIMGAVIDLLGSEPDGSIRYKVIQAIPAGHEQLSISPF